MSRRLIASLFVVCALFAAACGAEGADEAAESQTTDEEANGSDEENATEAPDKPMFGTIEAPCGAGDATVEESEAGKGTDKLYVGVANDRASTVKPGLNAVLYDASAAFVEWCNNLGGIAGLEIELVDLDGKVLEVEAAMTTACADTFAMVGGGYAQDAQMFTGKPESDFHQCGMIAIPGFAVSPDLANANGQVQPIPNNAYRRPAAWFADLPKIYPEASDSLLITWGNLPDLEANQKQMYATAEAVDGAWETLLDPIAYNVIGANDWDLLAQQILAQDPGTVGFVGEPENMANLAKALRGQDFDGPILGDTNNYDQLTIDVQGPEAAEGVVTRNAVHMFEEADKWPATEQLLEIMGEERIPSLGVQSFSAWLLFATVASECAADGPITRECVITTALDVHSWDGGGLHALTDPGANEPSACSMLSVVSDGQWVRLYPELGSDEDNGEGFSCPEPGVIDVSGEFGEGRIDESRGY